MNSYLITGAGGLVGSAIVAEFVKRGDSVVYAAGRQVVSLCRQFADAACVSCIEYDATCPFACNGLVVDCVIHAASSASPELFMASPVETMWSNVFGIRELLEFARCGGAKKVVYISSGEIYGKMSPRPTGYTESDYGFVDILSPRSSYPEGKRAAETLCASYAAEYGVNVCIARLGHTYGPTCSPKDRRVSSAFPWQAARGEDIVMKSAGTSMRSYTHCADVARGIITVCEKGLQGEAYNVANREGACSIRRMAEIVSAAGGVKLLTDIPNANERIAFNPMDDACLDSTKLEALGWRPTVGPEVGFAQTVQELRRKFMEHKDA